LAQVAPLSHSGRLAVQSVQLPPGAPQAVAELPSVQMPPEQQPLQAPAEQLPPGMHCEVDAEQTLPVGQSLGPLQPQWPLTQAPPALLPLQEPQLAPPVPQERLPCEA
jgi:hypothetical protein